MKVYKEEDEYNEDLPVEDREKISLLKLVDSGKYVKGIGIRDDKFYVIAENENDEMYLSIMTQLGKLAAVRKFDMNRLTTLLAIEESIQEQKDMLS